MIPDLRFSNLFIPVFHRSSPLGFQSSQPVKYQKETIATGTFLPPAMEGVNTNFFCAFSAFAITCSGITGHL
jgi:hypothetical protein